MRVKIKGTDGYETTGQDACNCLQLLKTIWGTCLNYKSSKPIVLSPNNTFEQYIVLHREAKSNDDYFKAFNIIVSVYEHLGGTLVHGTAFDDETKAIVDASIGTFRESTMVIFCNWR